MRLSEAVDGRESKAQAGPPYYRVDQRLAALDPALADRCRDEFLTRYAAGAADHPLACQLRAVYHGGGPLLRDVMFLDLETTGLSSSPLFLVGTLVAEEKGLFIRQHLARTYAEERSVIAAFAEEARERSLLVSFNGKSFDLPYLRARAAANGLRLPDVVAHLDLLHPARKVYGPFVPDCRLQTLERVVCRRQRTGDIPGEQIPEAYHYFVRTGNAVELARIVRHNAQDLATLLELMVRMLGAGQGPE